MIPANVITAWGVDHPWSTRENVEQDLLLSQAICAIAQDEYLGSELVFRGGTALHKLHLDKPYRYSEDLDYVRRTSSGIGRLTRALSDLGSQLGYTVRTRISQHPKVFWLTTSDSGVPLRIKIEVNTHERSPALPLTTKQHHVDTSWWQGRAEIRTFQLAELIATKIRALYQRSKGRDLFDLWLALELLQLPAEHVIEAFGPYRPDGITAGRARKNLIEKLNDPVFRGDLEPLVSTWPDDYNLDSAATLIIDQLLRLLDI